jgi:hypothetical protein
MPFGSSDYERRSDEAAMHAAIVSHVDDADVVLLPGAPLTHPDHALLTRTLLEGAVPCERLGLYAEQPYAVRLTRRLLLPDWISSVAAVGPFESISVGWRDRLVKLRAIRCYGSQLGPLALDGWGGGLRLGRLIRAEARAGGEAVAWAELER